VLLGVAACDRPADGDRRSATTPPATSPGTPPTSRAPATTPSAPVADRSVGQTIDDAGITAKVKTALAGEKDVSAMAINVDTVQGNVTLSGRVSNPVEAERAVQVARSVEGVKSVDSKLAVGS
jgi:hyperosmotically inducible protein